MFTGIIEELGEVVDWQPSPDAARLTVRGPLAVSDARLGDSISVNGVCLTVVEVGDDRFTADVMAETIAMSTLQTPATGTHVNLERAVRLGDRLGGHIVQGHIDGTSTVLSVAEGGAWRVLRLTLAPELSALVTNKGSIAVDGVSLTVSAVSAADAAESWFEVSLIPETLAATTLGERKVGESVNIETDILARQVERLLAVGAVASNPSRRPQAASSGTDINTRAASSGTDINTQAASSGTDINERSQS